MNYAIIDVGSNTVKMTLYAADKTLIKKYSHPTALLSYVKDSVLTPIGVQRLISTLADFQSKAKKQENTALFAYATASLRGLSNQDEVTAAIRDALGIEIRIVSGEEEAGLSFDGIAEGSGYDPYENTVFDLGGGSLEVITQENGSFTAHSFPVGALRMHLAFVKNVLPTKDELSAIYHHVQHLAEEKKLVKNRGEALAVGGSLRALSHILAHQSGIHYDENKPYPVTREDAVAFLKAIATADQKTKLLLLDLEPKRIHTIPTGLCAFLALLDLTEHQAFTVVSGGTREGYLNRIIKKETV